jgi:hypothetical protein
VSSALAPAAHGMLSNSWGDKMHLEQAGKRGRLSRICEMRLPRVHLVGDERKGMKLMTISGSIEGAHGRSGGVRQLDENPPVS